MSYSAPVDQLLKLGDTRFDTKWRNYGLLGLGPEHVAELIRMVQDEALHEGDGGSSEVWAPVHAWRALGQLRAEAAVEPLLGLLHRIDDFDDDAVGEEVPVVLGMIGPAALEPAAAYVADARHRKYARVAAGEALREIGQRYPDTRGEAVAALTRTLERFGEFGRDETFNGFLISNLVDLQAVEAAPLIERAFAADAIDTLLMGDWRKVAKELGIAAPAPTAAVPETPGAKKKRKRFRKKS
jgi:hypothetical protein